MRTLHLTNLEATEPQGTVHSGYNVDGILEFHNMVALFYISGENQIKYIHK